VTLEVVDLTAEGTHALRRSVLRFDTPTKVVEFAEDHWPGTQHLGITLHGALVGVSTWVPRPLDDRPGVQLRGMAVDRAVQGGGVGGVLLEAGVARMAAAGHRLVWARARDAALRFYLHHGFAVEGDGFVDEATQLPHHLIVRTLDP
jgi:GNAT superfamily N-acetyltransferase